MAFFGAIFRYATENSACANLHAGCQLSLAVRRMPIQIFHMSKIANLMQTSHFESGWRTHTINIPTRIQAPGNTHRSDKTAL